MISLKPLPYAYDALEPIISNRTISVHYEKHHKGYVDKLVGLLGEEANDTELLDIIKIYNPIMHTQSEHKAKKQQIWNNAAQHHHHEFYWESLSVQSSKIPAKLSYLIEKQFQHIDILLEKIHQFCIGLFGSGWVWLTVESIDSGDILHIESSSNAQFPIHKPLLVIDVWEHAYYLDYQNDRAKHTKALLKHLNWEKAAERFENCLA